MYFKVCYDKRKGNLQLVILIECDDTYIILLIGEPNDNKSNLSFFIRVYSFTSFGMPLKITFFCFISTFSNCISSGMPFKFAYTSTLLLCF